MWVRPLCNCTRVFGSTEAERRYCDMAQIQVSNLTFSYEGSSDTIFDQMSFTIDTDWKLGLIGRNGKGKNDLSKSAAWQI